MTRNMQIKSDQHENNMKMRLGPGVCVCVFFLCVRKLENMSFSNVSKQVVMSFWRGRRGTL